MWQSVIEVSVFALLIGALMVVGRWRHTEHKGERLLTGYQPTEVKGKLKPPKGGTGESKKRR